MWPCILQSKWHDLVAVKHCVCSKACVFFIWGMHRDLIVSRVGVHEREYLVTCCSIDQLVDPWKRKAVFGASFVEISEVDTGSPLSVGLGNKHGIGYPRGVVGLSDEPVFSEFLNFFLQSSGSFLIEQPSFLLDRRKVTVDVKVMATDVGVDSHHIFMRPGKDILVPSEKQIGRAHV